MLFQRRKARKKILALLLTQPDRITLRDLWEAKLIKSEGFIDSAEGMRLRHATDRSILKERAARIREQVQLNSKNSTS